jgi:hypothetical protein
MQYCAIGRIFIVGKKYIRKENCKKWSNKFRIQFAGFQVLEKSALYLLVKNFEQRVPWCRRREKETTCSFRSNISWYRSAFRSTSQGNIKTFIPRSWCVRASVHAATDLLCFKPHESSNCAKITVYVAAVRFCDWLCWVVFRGKVDPVLTYFDEALFYVNGFQSTQSKR